MTTILYGRRLHQMKPANGTFRNRAGGLGMRYRPGFLDVLGFVGVSTLARAFGQANKLSRTFATLLHLLNRYRGKGQQKADELVASFI